MARRSRRHHSAAKSRGYPQAGRRTRRKAPGHEREHQACAAPRVRREPDVAPGGWQPQNLEGYLRGAECALDTEDFVMREWQGGSCFSKKSNDMLATEGTVDAVLRHLMPDGQLLGRSIKEKDIYNLKWLMLETAAQETNCGHDGVKSKAACSLFQLEYGNSNVRDRYGNPQTNQFKETPQVVERMDPELVKRTMSLYDPSKSWKWNRECNVPWTCAMSFLHYIENTKGTLLNRDLSTVQARATLWKDRYNTSQGKGKPEQYVQNAKEHGLVALARAEHDARKDTLNMGMTLVAEKAPAIKAPARTAPAMTASMEQAGAAMSMDNLANLHAGGWDAPGAVKEYYAPQAPAC